MKAVEYAIKMAEDSGKRTEEKFKQLMLNKGFTVIKSNEDEDMFKHWDFKCKAPNKDDAPWVRYEVKARKKLNRNDKDYDDSILWIERRNKRGDIGWLYGEADYVVFSTKDAWLFVSRLDLVEFVESLMISEDLVYTKQLYRWYRRDGNLDEVLLLKMKDIESIITRRIEK
jgi:hypothetical protein